MPCFENLVARATNGSLTVHMAEFCLAAVLGYVIALVYRKTHPAFAERTFSDTLILLCLLISIVMVVIGDSVARAFSLVGALSIIRFRTAVQDPRDIAFVFFSLAVGMAVGAGRPDIAAVGTVVVIGVVGVIHACRVWRPNNDIFQLSFTGPPPDGTPAYDAVLAEHISARRLVAEKVSSPGQVRMSYRVRVKDRARWTDLARDMSLLDDLSGVRMKRR